MKAIILAAGKGTRLLPLTNSTPKPLAEVGGTPTINRTLLSLPDSIDTVIIIVGHLKEKIISHINKISHRYAIHFIEQTGIKGTYGAVFAAKDLLAPNERFLVLNGDDIYNKEELEEHIRYPRAFGIQHTIMPGYDSIHFDENGNVMRFYPPTEEEKVHGGYTAIGSYVIDSNIFDIPGIQIQNGEYGLPHTILAQKDIFPVKAIITQKWMPINSFEDIKKAEEILNKIDFLGK